MFRWCSTLSLLAALLVLPLAAHSDDNSNTLSQLRADLSQGQLGVLLQRQDIVPLPASTIKPWVQAQPIDRFAITGFNESDSRFAARVRLHFPDGAISFLRLEGAPANPYTLTDWYDYSSGMRLTALLEEGRWLQSEAGKAFLEALGESQNQARVANLAQGRPAALKLWLTQCLGKPCERIAVEHQLESEQPMVWLLRRAIASGGMDQYRQQHDALLTALGDDPYLWWLEGQYALEYQQCAWLASPLREAWLRHQEVLVLADVALQCTLNHTPEKTAFGTALTRQLPVATIMDSVTAFFAAHNRSVPENWRRWGQTSLPLIPPSDQE
ncbi:hypothetical protein [Alcanivorax sp. HI0044]|uniref:hypothetical protein n=2 Tax=unclassified Alcanivorax TaxID=2638842 RepID=UPI000AFF330A|nr:hypothetical protein [Alcanivorax sp. HI0044]